LKNFKQNGTPAVGHVVAVNELGNIGDSVIIKKVPSYGAFEIDVYFSEYYDLFSRTDAIRQECQTWWQC
jgi:hypothetical protein